MDMDEASRILNMELLGLTPADFDDPNQLRLIPNTDSDMVLEDWDEDDEGHQKAWWTFPDLYDETTDTLRDCEVTIGFDARTPLEAELAVTAITEFVKRRLTSLDHPVFTARIDN